MSVPVATTTAQDLWSGGSNRGTEGLTGLVFWSILPSIHVDAGPGSATES